MLVAGPQWYLSDSGTDSATCGLSQDTACRTFSWLLGRYQGHGPDGKLLLQTDAGFVVDESIVVCLFVNLFTCIALHESPHPVSKDDVTNAKD